MKILLGCEESGVVREAFKRLGHNAWSCDLLPSRIKGQHIQADILTILNQEWDMAIFFTPCTFLSNSGAHWLHRRPERWESMRKDALLFKTCMDADIPLKANENPVMHKYALEIIGRKHDQVIQPWQFGQDVSKKTCLWLQGLPNLQHTKIIPPAGYKVIKPNSKRKDNIRYEKRSGYLFGTKDLELKALWGNQTESGNDKTPESKSRQQERSKTYQGIANAMAKQWSDYVKTNIRI